MGTWIVVEVCGVRVGMTPLGNQYVGVTFKKRNNQEHSQFFCGPTLIELVGKLTPSPRLSAAFDAEKLIGRKVEMRTKMVRSRDMMVRIGEFRKVQS